MRDRFLVNIPKALPNFSLTVLNSFASGDDVFIHVHATADDLDFQGGHYMKIKDGKVFRWIGFDDSQKMAHAMKAVI